MLPTSWHSTSWFRHLIKQYKHMLTDPRDCCLFVFVRRGRWSLCVCEYVLFACGCLWWRNRPSDSLARLPMDLDKEVHYHKGLPGSGVVFP